MVRVEGFMGMNHQQKNDKTERSTGLGRQIKRGDRQGELNDSPSEVDEHQVSPASHLGSNM